MSRRMGTPKALLPLGDAPLLARVVAPTLEARLIHPVVIVTGHQADQIRRAMDGCDVQFVHNPEYEEGEMLSSVKAGVAAVAGCCDAFFLVLGDQPLVEASTYLKLIKTRRERRRIIQPTFGGRRGHPILIPSEFANEILSLPHDATLKTFTSAHRADTIEICVDDGGILADIDTPDDYHRALQNFLPHRSRPCINPMATV